MMVFFLRGRTDILKQGSYRKVQDKRKITDKDIWTPTPSTTTRTYHGAPPLLLLTDLGYGEVPQAHGKSRISAPESLHPAPADTVALLEHISVFRSIPSGSAAPRKPARGHLRRSSTDLRAQQGEATRGRVHQNTATGEDDRRHTTPHRRRRHLLNDAGRRLIQT